MIRLMLGLVLFVFVAPLMAQDHDYRARTFFPDWPADRKVQLDHTLDLYELYHRVWPIRGPFEWSPGYVDEWSSSDSQSFAEAFAKFQRKIPEGKSAVLWMSGNQMNYAGEVNTRGLILIHQGAVYTIERSRWRTDEIPEQTLTEVMTEAHAEVTVPNDLMHEAMLRAIPGTRKFNLASSAFQLSTWRDLAWHLISPERRKPYGLEFHKISVTEDPEGFSSLIFKLTRTAIKHAALEVAIIDDQKLASVFPYPASEPFLFGQELADREDFVITPDSYFPLGTTIANSIRESEERIRLTLPRPFREGRLRTQIRRFKIHEADLEFLVPTLMTIGGCVLLLSMMPKFGGG
jgi:hypothetical protein